MRISDSHPQLLIRDFKLHFLHLVLSISCQLGYFLLQQNSTMSQVFPPLQWFLLSIDDKDDMTTNRHTQTMVLFPKRILSSTTLNLKPFHLCVAIADLVSNTTKGEQRNLSECLEPIKHIETMRQNETTFEFFIPPSLSTLNPPTYKVPRMSRDGMGMGGWSEINTFAWWCNSNATCPSIWWRYSYYS